MAKEKRKKEDPMDRFRRKAYRKKVKKMGMRLAMWEILNDRIHSATEYIFEKITGIRNVEDTLGQKNEIFADLIYTIIYKIIRYSLIFIPFYLPLILILLLKIINRHF